MSIIYSYPTVQPTVDDLLIGTDVGEDNATKSFTVQSLVSLINAATGAGTVTSVQIATDSFLSATGGPITSGGVITIGLTATGTPSTNTFLRGDNQWVTPTVSAGITAQNASVDITNDMSLINFVGDGVTASAFNGIVTVSVPGANNAVESLLADTGISLNDTTGNITIGNTGVTSLAFGNNLSIVDTQGNAASTGDLQINYNGPVGTVTNVNAGTGLIISSGTSSTTPTIAVDYSANTNFIKLGEDSATALQDDIILFNQASSNTVKSTTFKEIQASTLNAVNTSLEADLSTVVKHNTDTYTSVATATNIITLTDAEYLGLTTKDANTLYFTTGTAATQYTKTLAIQNNITGGTAGVEYSIGGDQVGATRTGPENSAYSFSTTVSPNSGYQFTSGPTVNNASGTLDSTSTVTTTLSGNVQAIPAGTGSATVTINNNLTNNDGAGSSGGGVYTISATNTTLSGTAPFSFTSTSFGVSVTLNGDANTWELLNPNVAYSQSSGTASSGQNISVTATVTGTIQRKSYTLTMTSDVSGITPGTVGTEYSIATTDITTTNGNGSLTVNAGVPFNITSTLTANSGFSLTQSETSGAWDSGDGSVGSPYTKTYSSGITANTSLLPVYSGSASSTNGSVRLNSVSNSVTLDGNSSTNWSATYTSLLEGESTLPYTLGNKVTGPGLDTVTFTANITAASGYSWLTGPTFTVDSPGTNPQQIVGGADTDITGTISGSLQQSRTQIDIASNAYFDSVGACSSAANTTCWMVKGSGNSGAYAEQGDTLFQSQTGTAKIGSGYFRCQISEAENNYVGYVWIQGVNGVVFDVGQC